MSQCHNFREACNSSAKAGLNAESQEIFEAPHDSHYDAFLGNEWGALSHDDDYDPANLAFIECVPKEIVAAMQEELLLKQVAALEKAMTTKNASDESPMVRGHYERVLHELSSELLKLHVSHAEDVRKHRRNRSITSASTDASELDFSPTSSRQRMDTCLNAHPDGVQDGKSAATKSGQASTRAFENGLTIRSVAIESRTARDASRRWCDWPALSLHSPLLHRTSAVTVVEIGGRTRAWLPASSGSSLTRLSSRVPP